MNNEDMPREKLIKLGVEALEDYELLAIMLGSGTKNENVLDLSKRLINDYGLNRLLKMSYDELKTINGIKEAKASKLMASFEIARRGQRKISKAQLKDSKQVFEYLYPLYLYKEVEEFSIIYVDVKCRPICFEKFPGFDSFFTNIPVRKIVSKVLSLNAFGIFIAHNHPSGDIKPSKDDIVSTKVLQRTLREIDVMLLDHLIIGGNDFYSFSDNKLI